MDDSSEVPLILQGNEKLLFEQEEQDELPFPLPIQVIPSSEFFIWVNRTTSGFFCYVLKTLPNAQVQTQALTSATKSTPASSAPYCLKLQCATFELLNKSKWWKRWMLLFLPKTETVLSQLPNVSKFQWFILLWWSYFGTLTVVIKKKKNIAKGATDPRVEFISQVQTKILINLHLQNLDQASTLKSQPNISISTIT